MNFSNFDFDESTKELINTLDNNGRLPHAIIIEAKDKEKSFELARFLSMYAVCSADDKPCSACSHCIKASKKAHSDISYAYPEKKSKTYSIEQIRDIIADAHIRPNEANSKVYIFEEADNRLSVIAQNSFLKLLEEPPKNVYFFLLCENVQKFLITIRSRCNIVKLKSKENFDETVISQGESIVKGILSSREYDLMLALNVLSSKENHDEILSVVRLILRDGLAILSGGDSIFNATLGRAVATQFTKRVIIELITVTEESKIKIKNNININLLTTWLCGEYRRISWQR